MVCFKITHKIVISHEQALKDWSDPLLQNSYPICKTITIIQHVIQIRNQNKISSSFELHSKHKSCGFNL